MRQQPRFWLQDQCPQRPAGSGGRSHSATLSRGGVGMVAMRSLTPQACRILSPRRWAGGRASLAAWQVTAGAGKGRDGRRDPPSFGAGGAASGAALVPPTSPWRFSLSRVRGRDGEGESAGCNGPIAEAQGQRRDDQKSFQFQASSPPRRCWRPPCPRPCERKGKRASTSRPLIGCRRAPCAEPQAYSQAASSSPAGRPKGLKAALLCAPRIGRAGRRLNGRGACRRRWRGRSAGCRR